LIERSQYVLEIEILASVFKSNDFKSAFNAWKCCALNSKSTPSLLIGMPFALSVIHFSRQFPHKPPISPCNFSASILPILLHSQTLPQPIPQLGLPKLRQVIHTLLTQINALQLCHILRRRLANPLHDDRWIRLEDNAIIDNLVDRQGNQIIILNNGALVD
jgi:hypothetical protein